jgi:hypothetical protein
MPREKFWGEIDMADEEGETWGSLNATTSWGGQPTLGDGFGASVSGCLFVTIPIIELLLPKFVQWGEGDDEVPKAKLSFPSPDPLGTPYRACG